MLTFVINHATPINGRFPISVIAGRFAQVDLEPPRPAYQLLDEALAAGTVRVMEVSESGHVPELSLLNDGDQAVQLLDGEELIGAKQNRILIRRALIEESPLDAVIGLPPNLFFGTDNPIDADRTSQEGPLDERRNVVS